MKNKLSTSDTIKRGVWKNYDYQRVLSALKNSAGILTGLKRNEIIKDIKELRKQNTGHLY